MLELAYQGDIFQPAEAFLDPFPLSLADLVSDMPRRAPIDGAAPGPSSVLRYVRGHIHMPALGNELGGVEAFVATYRRRVRTWNLLQHDECCIALGATIGFQQFPVDDQSIAILYQQIAAIAQLRLLARSLACKLRIDVRRRFMRLVRALLAMKVHRRIASVIRRCVLTAFLRLKTFQARPRLQQRTVHGEMLLRDPPSDARLLHHLGQKFL